MKASNDDYSAAETKRRMDEGLRRALTTPHKPHASLKAKKSVSRPKVARRISKKAT